MVRSMKKTVRKVNKYVAPKSHKQQRCRQRTGEDIALGGGGEEKSKKFSEKQRCRTGEGNGRRGACACISELAVANLET